MPNGKTKLESRVKESYRVRACAAGMSVGAAIFLFGTGVAMPLALDSAWLAALCALPVCALAAWASREIAAGKRERPSRAGYALLAFVLFGNAVFAASALVNFAEQTLLRQSRAAVSAAMTVLAVYLSALPGATGSARLSFALRWGLPLGMAALVLFYVPVRTADGLFPLLGAGPMQLLLAALCMAGAASPALMAALPPPEIAQHGEAAKACPVPGARFFIIRALLGAGVGVLFVLFACASTTYESIGESMEWGARMRIAASAQPREGIAQTLLVILEMLAAALLAVNMLAASELALARAMGKTGRSRAGLFVLSLLMLAALFMFVAFGSSVALGVAPLLSMPMGLVIILRRKMGDAS